MPLLTDSSHCFMVKDTWTHRGECSSRCAYQPLGKCGKQENLIGWEVFDCRQKLAQLSEKSKKNITEQSWKQASPMKKSTGPGDFYGSLQGRIPHVSVSPPVISQGSDDLFALLLHMPSLQIEGCKGIISPRFCCDGCAGFT